MAMSTDGRLGPEGQKHDMSTFHSCGLRGWPFPVVISLLVCLSFAHETVYNSVNGVIIASS